LSSAQKRDLLGHAVAAVITTALMAAPLVNSNGARGSSATDPAAPVLASAAVAGIPAVSTSSAAAPVTTLTQLTPPAEREPQRTSAPRRRPRAGARSAALTAVAAPVTADSFGNMAYARVTNASVLDESSRKPRPRKLVSWLTGDGTHSVRPFPTVSTDRP
jgi:hypothetical protein